MLPYTEWLDQALLLRDKENKRIPHLCGKDTPLSISRDGNVFYANCFRCNDGGVYYKTPTREDVALSLSNYLLEDTIAQESFSLPSGGKYSVESWDMRNRVWLYKRGFTDAYITKIGMFELPNKRVVIPSYNEKGEVVYWQARNNQPLDVPKYLNPRVSKNVYGTWGLKESPFVVVTEDLLSMYKVGREFLAVCLLGTALNKTVVKYLIELDKPVFMWLDNDSAGWEGTRKLKRVLDLVGISTYTVLTGRDPKDYCYDDIKEIIYDYSRTSTRLGTTKPLSGN